MFYKYRRGIRSTIKIRKRIREIVNPQGIPTSSIYISYNLNLPRRIDVDLPYRNNQVKLTIYIRRAFYFRIYRSLQYNILLNAPKISRERSITTQLFLQCYSVLIYSIISLIAIRVDLFLLPPIYSSRRMCFSSIIQVILSTITFSSTFLSMFNNVIGLQDLSLVQSSFYSFLRTTISNFLNSFRQQPCFIYYIKIGIRIGEICFLYALRYQLVILSSPSALFLRSFARIDSSLARPTLGNVQIGRGNNAPSISLKLASTQLLKKQSLNASTFPSIIIQASPCLLITQGNYSSQFLSCSSILTYFISFYIFSRYYIIILTINLYSCLLSLLIYVFLSWHALIYLSYASYVCSCVYLLLACLAALTFTIQAFV